MVDDVTTANALGTTNIIDISKAIYFFIFSYLLVIL